MEESLITYGKSKKSVVLILVTTLVVTPVLIIAQETEATLMARAIADAQADAEAAVDKTLWLAVGCFGGFWGIIGASVLLPNPNQTRLIGKSPEYIIIYTDAFKQRAKSIQTKTALKGCIISQATAVVSLVCILLVAAATAD